MRTLTFSTVALTAATAIAAAVTWAVNPALIERLCREDGVVEYATAALYLLAAIGFAAAARLSGWRGIWAWGLAGVTFLVAGEEVSWGQRIFGIATPAPLQGVNVQKEMNLHNVDGLHQNVRALGLLFVLGVCYFAPIANRVSARVRTTFSALGVPLLPLPLLFTVSAAIAFMGAPRLSGAVVFELDEIGEALLGLAFAIYGVSAVAQRPRQAPSAAAEDTAAAVV